MKMFEKNAKIGPQFFKIFTDPNLDLLCVRQSDTGCFCKNYAKLYFDTKHLEKRLNKGGEIFGGLFWEKVPFLANIGRCPNFLD